MNSNWDIKEFKNILLEEIIDNADIKTLIKAAYNYLDLPIIVLDPAFNVIAYAYSRPFYDEVWEYIAEHGAAQPDDIMNRLLKLDYYDKISSSTKAIYFDADEADSLPQTGIALRVYGSVEGSLGLVVPDPSYVEDILEITNILGRTVSFLMERNFETLNQGKNRIKRILSQEIFSDTEGSNIITESNIKHYFAPKYIFAVAKQNSSSSGQLPFLSRYLLSTRSSAFVKLYDDKLEIFFSNIYHKKSLCELESLLEELSVRHNVCFALSQSFSNLEKRMEYLKQAEKTMEVALKLSLSHNLFHYEDYFIDIIFSYAIENLDISSFMLPEIKKLLEFDRENDTEYFLTLENYLNNLNNTAITANIMHLHRNTLMYRLNKISDIIDKDINNADTAHLLWSSIRMYHLADMDSVT